MILMNRNILGTLKEVFLYENKEFIISIYEDSNNLIEKSINKITKEIFLLDLVKMKEVDMDDILNR